MPETEQLFVAGQRVGVKDLRAGPVTAYGVVERYYPAEPAGNDQGQLTDAAPAWVRVTLDDGTAAVRDVALVEAAEEAEL